ncbi:putative lea domain protein [Phaeomoniella chlamydospora]|uniref:Putative lea domain protein n=1 Tax=Phaeomoniella chlamydospora TaxID=158046 RepID=A0A0G2F166_PHACM|nr:putative lea domain protein [Phaeomoniella chlamydospora]
MAPAPAAGKTPTTPTRSGKSPASNITPKLSQAGDSARKPPKLGPSKASTPKSVSKATEGTDSPKLPPRPQAAEQATEDVQGTADDAESEVGGKIGMKDNEEEDTPQGKISQASETEAPSSAADTTDLSERAPEPVEEGEDTVEGAKDTAENISEGTETPDVGEEAEGATGKATGALGGIGKKVTDTADKAADTGKKTAGGLAEGDVEGATQGAKETIQDTGDDVEETAGDAKDTAEDTAGDATETAEGAIPEEAGDAVDGAKDTTEGAADEAGEAVDGAKDTAEGATDEAGEAVDGVKETAEDTADQAGEAVDEAQDELPDIPIDLSVLKGLEVSEEGKIMDQNGEQIGQLEEGDWEDLVGQTIGDDGEILDEDGDVIGRCSVLPDRARELYEQAQEEANETAEGAADQVQEFTPDLDILDGLEVGPDGNILNEEGDTVGQVVEGDPHDFTGYKVNAEGEVLDEDGDVIGRAKTIPQQVTEKAEGAVDEAKDGAEEAVEGAVPEELQQAVDEAVDALKPDLSLFTGKKLNKKGKILDEDGEPIGQLAEGYDLAKCAGKPINESGEILDENGEVIGKVEVVEGEAAENAMRELHPELVEQLEKAQQEAEEAKDGVDEAKEEAPLELPDISVLEGLKVNKKGEVINEDGDVIAKLSEGYDVAQNAGKKINEKGEVLDSEGNVIGKVELVPEAAELVETAEETGPELPPLSILDGLKVNKAGLIVNENGDPVGKLIEGDAKKLSKMGVTCDAEGRFWDTKGNIIGRAETTPQEETEGEEAPFSGLEGLIVVKDGWVEDENNNRVGQLVEGDAKKLVGRAVDEDGDVIDKRGNVVGHAERYEEPEEEEAEPEPVDLSELKGLTVNKQGNVIGPQGVPIGRLVEGNPKELSGRTIDEEGQIWNDSGKVIGRCELIPVDEREAKPEGIFGGLEGLHVVAEGLVEDEEGNVVGRVIEGDPKKLIGQAVDEDGEIIDKYGNVKGRCEPYEIPEEEEPEPEDLSSLAGKIVNKQGNVVDEHGTIFGRIAEGDPAKLAGRKVDGEGNIWSDDGKVIGRAELIPGAEQQRPEGIFSGWENLTIGNTKYQGVDYQGVVLTPDGKIVGRVIEGDAEKLEGRKVDEDGDILDKSGNAIGKAERWKPEEKKKEISPMAGHKVNKDGEVRDENGELIGKLTAGNLKTLIGKEVDENGYVVDNEGNKIGECTLIENLDEEGPTEEELAEQRKAEEDAELANKMSNILQQTLERIEPHVEKADRTPRDELDEEQLVQEVKPLIEEGSRILQECNGAIRGLDPDGRIAANAKARAANREATPEEYRLADLLKELTTTVVKTIDDAKKKIADMPHAKKKLNPLWGLLTEPLFQILAAVGLLLAGVLGLVGRLLSGLGLGGLVNGLLGGLGIDKLLGGLGLGSIAESLGLGGGKKKK